MARCLPWLRGTYHAQPSQGTEQEKTDYTLNNKRRVIRLVLQWAAVHGDVLQEDDVAVAFLEVRGVIPSQSMSLSYDPGLSISMVASLERLWLQILFSVNMFIRRVLWDEYRTTSAIIRPLIQ